MLRKASDLTGLRLGATDGEIGRVEDFYFDDQTWTVRYLVADTGKWLTGRRVLISPFALENVDPQHTHLNVKLTKEQIERSPSIDQDKPVSRQFETDYARYYGWPMYWYGPALWGPTPYPVYDGIPREPIADPMLAQQKGDPHLRSASEVKGYYLHARDGDLGHVEDFIIADADWAIRYFVIDTKNWWPGKRALISTQWIKEVSWDKSNVSVDLTRELIKVAPEYTGDVELSRDFEARLHSHYRRSPYWERTSRQQAA
jgi:hypothetical protein